MTYTGIRTLAVAMLALPLMMLCSCDGEKKKGGDITINLNGPLMNLDSQDTIIVRQMSTEFMDFLKAKDYRSALSMLYYLDPDSTIIPLPNNMAARQLQIFQIFPVLDYRCDGIQFRTESDCQVKYTITFFEKDGPEDTRNNTTAFFLQPVRYEGQWYLTVRDSATPNGAASQIEN